MGQRMYVCIDLKSFYASVECVERGLDPMAANLAVADPKRGKGTICLAITPSMKALGIPNRCRIYQIPPHVEYIMAPPRMKLYLSYAADIYALYLKYVATEDIHVYSIDEAFLDVTGYLSLYRLTARELAMRIMGDIQKSTGIPAAAGIGTNLYLAKVALDILAKHAEGSIGCLDETSFREMLWDHRPLTDFWRVGAGTQERLAHLGILTMRDIAHADPGALYRMFGVDTELLIDHAWGRESARMEDIKAYQPKSSVLSRSQVLLRDYTFDEGKLIIKEMADGLCLDLAGKGLAAQAFTLRIGYSYETGLGPSVGTVSLEAPANSYQAVVPSLLGLYGRIAKQGQPIRKATISCGRLVGEGYQQYSLFTDSAKEKKEKDLQKAILEVKQRYGKNAIVRGMDLLGAGTAMERNRQIGGHRSGE